MNTTNDKIIHMPQVPKCEPQPQGLGVFFMEKMKQFSDQIGQIEAETGATWTYREILEKSIRVAQHLEEYKLNSEDVISLCSYNTMECSLPFYASQFLGLKVASLDPTLSKNDVNHLLNLVKPKLIFSGPESVTLLETVVKELKLGTKIVVYGETETHIPFTKFLQKTNREDKFQVKKVDDLYETAFIFFSSGTTGYPKGICIHHYGLITGPIAMLKECDPSVFLSFTTFYWISAVTLLTMAIMTGGARVLCKTFDEHNFLKYVQDYKVSYCFLAPIHIHKLLMTNEFNKYNTKYFTHVTVGGGAIGEEYILKIREKLPHTCLSIGYGMTEVGGALTGFFPKTDADVLVKNPKSCGRPLPGISYRIVDNETGKILGPNEPGEIQVKSNLFMKEYYKNPEDTRKAFTDDGYLKTGDVGYYNEDLCFYITNRIKEMLKFKSWHIVPTVLEDILLSHPDILECIVIGIPHEADGEHPAGVIVLKENSIVTEEDILKYYNDRIDNEDRKKLRGGIFFVDNIPRTPSSKPRRIELRNMILQKL